MDAGIILSGRSPNIIGEYARGLGAAQLQTEMARRNALAELYAQQGPQIMAGQPQALNALAAYDPAVAMGIQGAQLDQQATRQGMAYDAERMQMQREAAKRQAEALLREQQGALSAAQAAEHQRTMTGILAGGATAHQQGPQAFAGWLAQSGLQGLSYEQFPIWAAQTAGEIDALDAWTKMQPKAPQPMSTPGKINADVTAGFLTPDQAAAAMKPQPGVVVNTGGDNKQIFDAMDASATSARQAMTGLAGLQEASKALDAGTITGAFADQRLAAAKLGALLGVTDPAVIQNTETFRAAIAPQVAAIMKATVGSTQISNADREFAERASGGSIALDEGTITRLLGIMEKAANVAIDAHRARLDAVYPPGQGFDRERALFGVGVPATPAPGQGSPASGSVLDDQTLQLLDPETRQWYLDFVGPSSN